MNNIFVGNLSFTATKDDVQKLFGAFGSVVNVRILEKKKGTSRGFGFVDMPNDDEPNKAMKALHGKAADSDAGEHCERDCEVGFHRVVLP